MNTASANYLRRSLAVNEHRKWKLKKDQYDEHRERVLNELRDLGVTRYGLFMTESHYLPHVIHPSEHIGGVAYGRFDGGFAMMLATDRRVIFLDKRPLFMAEDEIDYDVVSGVSFGYSPMYSTVTLHTKIKDYTVRTMNKESAKRFVSYIEARCLEHGPEGYRYDQAR